MGELLQKPAVLAAYKVSQRQARAALVRQGDVAVNAGAGTGKTRTLVARYLALLSEPEMSLRGIVAVTFTRKAAREMRNRVRQEIGVYLGQTTLTAAERATWEAAYAGLDAARIGTIHNLCGEILRAHPAELALDPRFEVLDERQAALLQKEVVEASLAWVMAPRSAAPRSVGDEAVPETTASEMAILLTLWREGTLTALIELLMQQRLVVGELFTACPPAESYARWQAVLTARQEEALAEFWGSAELQAWHTFLQRQKPLKRDDKMANGQAVVLTTLAAAAGKPLAEQIQILARLGEVALAGGAASGWPGGKAQVVEVRAALKGIKAVWLAGQGVLGLALNEVDAQLAAAMPAVARLFAYIDRLYQQRKAELDVLDFDDLEQLSLSLLERDEAVRAYWQGEVQALLVDEFQDTNERQRAFIRQLCPTAGKLFIVGDAKQSIYAFRGAKVAVFQQAQADIVTAGGEVIDLDRSYRAHGPLLAAMNALLAPVLGAGGRPWEAAFAPLQAGEPDRNPKLAAPYVEFHLGWGAKEEGLQAAAHGLVARLQEIVTAGVLTYGDMAILCRTSSAFAYYEDALDKVGVPYVTVAGKGFYERPEIRDILNSLQAIADPHDDIALVGFWRSPVIGLTDAAVQKLVLARVKGESLWQVCQRVELGLTAEEGRGWALGLALLQQLTAQAGRQRVADICQAYLLGTGYRAFLRAEGALRALRNIDKLLRDIHTSGLVDIDQYLASVALWRSSGSREGEARATATGAVQIMSIHASKGLEFPLVVLGDAGSGDTVRADTFLLDEELGFLGSTITGVDAKASSYLLGNERAKAQGLAEQARLLYVALTRAEEMLLINGHVKQKKNGAPTWSGWLKSLAAVTGLEQQTLIEGEGCQWQWQGIALAASVYAGDGGERPATAVVETMTAPLTSVADEWPLLAPVTGMVGIEDGSEVERSLRVWQVVPRQARPSAPAWVVGSLVHEALAWWRFPEAASFRPWVTARVRQYGLADRAQQMAAVAATADLVGRFRQSDLYTTMAAAESRWTEVPFSHEVAGRVVTGYIDALYQDETGWTIVDFKTDYWADEAALATLLAEHDYEAQMGRYEVAVQALLGVPARKVLCWLNGKGGQMKTMVLG